MSFNFSVLNPDTALNPPVKNKKKQDKDKDLKKTKVTTNGVNKNVKKKSDVNDLRAMAFGHSGGKTKQGSKKGSSNNKENEKNKKSKKNKEGDETDDDWQKRDDEFVKAENEKALRAAIIQSKLDFEKNKTLEKEEKEASPVKEESSESKKSSKNNKTKKKKDKAVVLSLDQFNSLQPEQIQKIREGGSIDEEKRQSVSTVSSRSMNGGPTVMNDKFFNEVDELTKQTLLKERRQKEYMQNAKKSKTPDDSKKVAKLVQDIEKQDFEIQALRLEVESLRDELKTVKTRNKKLCEVMGSSEMRSKGELVVELEKASRSRDEISEEVARLSGDLEQERTKVSHLTQELKRLGGRKRAADSK